MRNYWSCSKFADWLRGTPKPKAETGKGWNIWRENAKKAHEFRYWLAEEGLDRIQDFILYIPDKIYAVKYYINNRWITRTHSLTAHPRDIHRGEWCDVGNRFLPCLFNELVDFVEVELAWWHLVWEGKEKRAKYNAPWWRFGWWNVRLWRCRQAGLDNLEWQRNLKYDDSYCVEPTDEKFGKPTDQAIKAQEILDLYTWWTEVYPNRPDPMKVSGWSAICDRERAEGRDLLDLESRNEQEAAEKKAALDMCSVIEAAYEKEDEEMLIRLIKVRHALWT